LGIGSILILGSEISLLLLVVVLLFIVNPILCLLTFLYFSSILYFLQRTIAQKIYKESRYSVRANLDSANVFMDMFNNFRELRVGNNSRMYEVEYENFRFLESKSSMKILLLNIFPKYMITAAKSHRETYIFGSF
jgi:hypothetical protein